MRDQTYRTSETIYTVDQKWRPLNKNGNPYLADKTYVFDSTQVRDVRFRSDIRKGNYINALPYVASEVHVSPGTFRYEAVDSSRNWTTSGERIRVSRESTAVGSSAFGNWPMIGLDANFNPLVPLDIKNRATNEALLKMKESVVDLGQTFGEVRQTASMMHARLRQLLRLFRLVATRRFGAASRELGLRNRKNRLQRGSLTLAEAWLEFKLGWLPLMNDIFNGKQAIMDLLKKEDLIRVTAVEEGVPSLLHNLSYTFKGKRVVGCQAGFVAGITNQDLDRLTTIGLLDPALPWELMPLTFVTDWFVDVGSFLSAIGSKMGTRFVSGYYTLYSRANGIAEELYFSPRAGISWTEIQRPNWRIRSFAMERNLLHEFPLPAITFGDGLDNNSRQTLFWALAVAKSATYTRKRRR